MLKNESDEWVEDYSKLKCIAVDFFKSLFLKDALVGDYEDTIGVLIDFLSMTKKSRLNQLLMRR